MARHIHIHIATKDAGNFEESKHPRAENGQFGKGSGGGAKPAAKKAPAAKTTKSEPKEGDVGHEELTKYGKYLTKGEKVKGPRGEQVEVIRHTGPEVLTTGGSYHPTKLSRVDGGEKRAQGKPIEMPDY